MVATEQLCSADRARLCEPFTVHSSLLEPPNALGLPGRAPFSRWHHLMGEKWSMIGFIVFGLVVGIATAVVLIIAGDRLGVLAKRSRH